MSVKDINIKNCTYYFFDIINTKDFDPNNIKIHEKLYKIFLLYQICENQKRPKDLQSKSSVP